MKMATATPTGTRVAVKHRDDEHSPQRGLDGIATTVKHSAGGTENSPSISRLIPLVKRVLGLPLLPPVAKPDFPAELWKYLHH
jgi:hypothetical protein